MTTVDTPVQEVVGDEDGTLAGARLTHGRVVARSLLAVATRMEARAEGLDGPKLPMRDLPDSTGRGITTGRAGSTEVPGVRAAGEATDLAAQVGASTVAGAHTDSAPAIADTEAGLAAAQGDTPAL